MWSGSVQLYYFLTSGLDGGEWLASCSGRFNLAERIPVTTELETDWFADLVMIF